MAHGNKETSRLTTPLYALDVEDEATTVTTTTAPTGWAKFAPRHAPFSWLVINAGLCLWSLLLVIEIAMDPELHPLERTHLYLLWNFGSCICWCTELALTAWADYQETNRTNKAIGSSWAKILEFVLAIYFTSDSIQVFRQWRQAEDDIVGELFDASLATLAYGYIVLKAKPFKCARDKIEIKDSSHMLV